MDRIINIKVGGNYLSKDNKNAGVRGEANVTKLRVTFDEGWDSYAKTITFWDAHGNNPVKRIQGIDLLEDITKDTGTYVTLIPKEPLAIAGELTFVIDGYHLDGKRQRSISDKLVVKDAPITDNAAEPTDPTPSQAEQLQGQIDKFMGDVQAAVIARDETKSYRDEAEGFAQQTSEDATSAEENANKAIEKANEAEQSATKAEGAVGKTSYIGENGNWYAWDSKVGEFYDTGVKAQSGSTVYYGDNPPDEADVWINPNGNGLSIDSKMSDTSENLVQNKVIKEYVDTTLKELQSQLGDVSDLPNITGGATNLTAAAAENWSIAVTAQNMIGNMEELPSEGSKTVTSEITKLSNDLGNLNELETGANDSFVSAVNELAENTRALDTGVTFHVKDTNIHITADERNAWNDTVDRSQQNTSNIEALSGEVNSNTLNLGTMQSTLSDLAQEKANQTDLEALQTQVGDNSSVITDMKSQIGDIETVLADIQADQEALINGGEE